LKARKGYKEEGVVMQPSNIPFVLIGTGLLWMGWFGFNAGSALAANDIAVRALVNTHFSAATASLVWFLLSWYQEGKASTIGMISGAVVGLVAVTPAAGYVDPWAAVVIGILAGIFGFLAANVRLRSSIDESLDAWSIHGVGGIVGTLSVGIFGLTALGAPSLLDGGTVDQLILQIIAVVIVIIYSFVVSYILALIIHKTVGLRVSEEEEKLGLDLTQHGETANV